MQHRDFNNVSSMIGTRFAVDGADLIVWFKGGKVYRVHNAADRADEFAASDSAGRFYNENFKTGYTVTRDADKDE